MWQDFGVGDLCKSSTSLTVNTVENSRFSVDIHSGIMITTIVQQCESSPPARLNAPRSNRSMEPSVHGNASCGFPTHVDTALEDTEDRCCARSDLTWSAGQELPVATDEPAPVPRAYLLRRRNAITAAQAEEVRAVFGRDEIVGQTIGGRLASAMGSLLNKRSVSQS